MEKKIITIHCGTKPEKLTGRALPSIGDPDMEAMERWYRENPDAKEKFEAMFPRVSKSAKGNFFIFGTGGDMSNRNKSFEELYTKWKNPLSKK